MRTPLPRRLVHQGVVEAGGFFVDATLVGEAEARRRVLSLWMPGTRVQRLREGWLVSLPRPQAVRCDASPGLPLTETAGRVLVGSPLTSRELEELQPIPGTVDFLQAGEWIAASPSPAESEDLSAWLDVEGFEAALGTRSLGEPPAVPRKREDEPPAFEPRAKLGGIAPAPPALSSLIAALRAKAKRPGKTAGHGSVSALAAAGLSAVRGLRALFAKGVRGAPSGSRKSLDRSPAGPSRWQGILQKAVLDVLLATRLSRLVGRQHASYIQKMIEMFQSGDLNAALRHAIPLDSGIAESLKIVTFRRPSPRADLRINPGLHLTASAVSLGNDLYSDLRQMYRETVARLEAQGRIEEAAFLLAEVLQAHEEAVAFLERHGNLRLAAELAEGRKLAPGLVVRQWFLAGERERALEIARRTGAFADAVSRLETSGKKQEAGVLRLLWAHQLASAGDYTAAVDAAWLVPEARALALNWIDRAIAQGGALTGRMLAHKVVVSQGPFGPIRDQVMALLESPATDDADARRVFAEALMAGPTTPEVRVLARAAARALARDSARLGARMPPVGFRKLVELSGDAALRADFQSLPQPAKVPWLSSGESIRIDVDPWDVGGLAVHDAAFLLDGRIAVALGEMGVRLISRDGRTVAVLDQPAHRLVVADRGDRAIALARRGEVWRLARLDFQTRRAVGWTDARIGAWAANYDGSLWLVAGPDGLVAVDALGSRFDGPWGVSDLPGPITLVERSHDHASLLIDGREPQVWTYELPSFTLRAREPVPAREPDVLVSLSRGGSLVQQWTEIGKDEDEKEVRVIRIHVPGKLDLQFFIPLSNRPARPLIAGDWIVSSLYGTDGLRVYLIHLPTGTVRGTITLGRTTRAVLRLLPWSLTVADELGRVLVVDLEHGLVRRNLRL
jgi:hypothetical protein